jgi:uncharacterized protein (DUF1810 family)
MKNDISRFLQAQENVYESALSEIKSGRKEGHWMWFIFPQIKGLGYSSTSIYYSIEDINEAREFLNHPILGSKLRQVSSELLKLEENNAYNILGSPDDIKLKSCMTLFLAVNEEKECVFRQVLDKFFNGELDNKTLHLLKE